MASPKVYYLCGPMTGYPQFNIPLFQRAAQIARRAGILVVSPAELDDPQIAAASLASKEGNLVDGKINGHTWGDLLSRDVKVVADQVQGILLLEGWWHSRGARLEVLTGLLCGHEFLEYYDDVEVIGALPTEAVRDTLREHIP